MKTNLLSRMAAAVVAGLMLFSFSAPVLAEEAAGNIENENAVQLDGSIDGIDTGALSSIDVYKGSYVAAKNVPRFVDKDGTVYYSMEVSKKPMGDPDKTIREILERGVWFHGWDLEGKNTADVAPLAEHWGEIGRAIQLNTGLVKMDNLTKEGYGIGGGHYSENSLKDAENKALSSDVNNINKKYTKKALQNEDKRQPVMAYMVEYSPFGSRDENNHAAIGVYLYNFKVSPLMTNEYLKWAAEKGKASVEDNVKHNTAAKLGVFNDTPLSKNDQQEISIGVDETSTKEENGSSSYSFTESTKVSAEMQFGPVKGGAELGFSAQQAFSKGWSKSESVTNKSNVRHAQSINLLPYSGVNLLNTTQSGKYAQKIDFPVAISYDVKIVNYGQPGNPKDDVIATYEGNNGRGSTDAQSDLYQRYFNKKENQNIKYEGDKYPFSVENAISTMAKTAPYFTAEKTVFNGNISDAKSVSAGFIAMHPLSSVDTTKEVRNLSIKPGGMVECRDIPLKGYLDDKYPDGKGGTGEYATFNRNCGHWEIQSGSDVVKIVTDSQNRQKIQGIKEGKAEVIYRIDEKVYNSNDDRNHFTTNSELKGTAVLTVNVSNDAGENTGLINTAMHALEAAGNGWSVDDGYILGAPDGSALTDLQIPTDGLEGIAVKTTGRAATGGGYEAVSMKLTGENTAGYDVYYRSYVDGLGWMNWAKNGQLSGTSGDGLPVTAVQVMILESDARPAADDAVTPAYFMENMSGSDAGAILEMVRTAKDIIPDEADNSVNAAE